MKQIAGIRFYEEDLYICDMVEDKPIYACIGYEGANMYRIEVYVDHAGDYRLYQCQLRDSLDIKFREHTI